MDTAWIAAISALGGSALGTLSTYFLNNQKMKFDLLLLDKNKKLENKIEEEKEFKLRIATELRIYNEFLKLDGERRMVKVLDDNIFTFDIQYYQNVLRNVLFREFDMLKIDVRAKIREIDKEIINGYEDYSSEQEWETNLSKKYNQLVEMIEERYAPKTIFDKMKQAFRGE